ncbi:hypothetical protein BJ508DRAFT_141259 [Ascobolus immersus RN42]|uniref:F-box domain-containing protein n=1 Tax=Ascobolus immersus RN42 TaxID=1160509 RepID=A0A3N4ICJ5_ASCIM|nr:hypothetical protein BJ508DRAFT_141259 [Ascobolus immersus RN42]
MKLPQGTPPVGADASLLLLLPTELRLCIYEWSTTLSLLQLTSTCRTIRYEIHGSPSIIRSSLGYWRRDSSSSLSSFTPSSASSTSCFTVNDICMLDTDVEVHLWHALYGCTIAGNGSLLWVALISQVSRTYGRSILFRPFRHRQPVTSLPVEVQTYWSCTKLQWMLHRRRIDGGVDVLHPTVGAEEMEKATKRGPQDRFFMETMRDAPCIEFEVDW